MSKLKFRYQYHSKDNERLEGILSAASRDLAFAELKRRGIKPIKVELAPGLTNRLTALGKRGWAIVGLAMVLMLALGLIAFSRSEIDSLTTQLSPIESMERRQVIGDSGVIEKGIRTGWATVFPEVGERFLASFAIPGVPAGLRSTEERELRNSLSRSLPPQAEDGLEARQIKSMVEGMKVELRAYLAAGGTIKGYGARLVERQDAELAIYNRAQQEFERAQQQGIPESALEALWEGKNAELRRLGIRLLPFGE